MIPKLRASNLRLERSDKLIFDIPELSLDKGSVVALVGPNGAGKTSLLLTLSLLEPPTSGAVELDGEAANRKNLRSFRRRMALVFQEALLLDTSVERNLLIALRMRGVNGGEASRRADRWLRQFGVKHLAHRSARRLSGGEAQRTSLARAFALEPEILFLDEPFSALDHPTRKALLNEMGPLLEEMGMTTLFVTHDYSEIPFVAPRVAVLYEGRIIRSGSVREVFGEQILDKRVWAPWEE